MVLLPIWETWSPFYVIHVSLRTSDSISRTASLSAQLFCRAYQCFQQANTHTRLTAFVSGTTLVSRYKKGKTNLDVTEARDSEWQWYQLDYMQVCTSLQTDNHASTSPVSFYRQIHRPNEKITVKNQNYLISNGVLLTVM